MPVYILATCDTKGREAEFVRDALRDYGADARLVDTSCAELPQVEVDIPRQTLLNAEGDREQAAVWPGDRGAAVARMADLCALWIEREHQAGRVEGVLGIGGSAGTTIATAAMRRLPVGVPKVMISTLASGNVRPWVGNTDIAMFNSIVDIAGVNRISRQILGAAARAMAGMVRFPDRRSVDHDKPIVAASMFGVTTPCVEAARSILEREGYEVLVFHATGSGGEAMESLINEGMIAGVLDITTTELADELVGGFLSAGPQRLTAAGRRGIPQVISVGALDMVNFGPRETVPSRFSSRTFHIHNPTVTLMRTTPEENSLLGEEIGNKSALASGPVRILLPRGGVSALDAPGKPFDDPAARESLFAGIRRTAGNVPVIERTEHINDPRFAQAAAEELLNLLAKTQAAVQPVREESLRPQ